MGALSTALCATFASRGARDFRRRSGAVMDAVENEVRTDRSGSRSRRPSWAFRPHAAAGDWRAAVEGLIQFNAFIMKRRGGAAWIRLEKDTVKVDYREEGADLADPTELERPWRNTYFINSLHGVKRELSRN